MVAYTTTIARNCNAKGRAIMYSYNPRKTKEKKERKGNKMKGGTR
jgi:hypothetical protein